MGIEGVIGPHKPGLGGGDTTPDMDGLADRAYACNLVGQRKNRSSKPDRFDILDCLYSSRVHHR